MPQFPYLAILATGLDCEVLTGLFEITLPEVLLYHYAQPFLQSGEAASTSSFSLRVLVDQCRIMDGSHACFVINPGVIPGCHHSWLVIIPCCHFWLSPFLFVIVPGCHHAWLIKSSGR
jgi:hypothetical protein